MTIIEAFQESRDAQSVGLANKDKEVRMNLILVSKILSIIINFDETKINHESQINHKLTPIYDNAISHLCVGWVVNCQSDK